VTVGRGELTAKAWAHIEPLLPVSGRALEDAPLALEGPSLEAL
jgi:hypothetical protein